MIPCIVILHFDLRQLNGEELQGLSFKELQKLEGRLESSLNCVYKAKVHHFSLSYTQIYISAHTL